MSKLLHVHFVQTATFREEMRNERAWLVVPGIILQEQVLNYYFVPASEINHFVSAWNGAPVTMAHPDTEDGSAGHTEYAGIVGNFYNAQFDVSKNQLKGEFWLDLALLRNSEAGRNTESNVRSGKVMDVSTGYWADEEMTQGVWNDHEYFAIHRNLRPDHVAILLDQTGACSVADGCGMPRTNCVQCQSDGMLTRNFQKTKKQRSIVMFKGFRKTKPTPVTAALSIEDAGVLESLRGLGLKVEKGQADGEYLVTNENTPAPTPAPASDADGDSFLNELKTAFDGIGGVVGFTTMLNDLQAMLDGAKRNAQTEQARKQALVVELKKNANCTLSEETLMKMSVTEIESIQSALTSTFGNFSMLDTSAQNTAGGNGSPAPKRAIGLAGSLKKKEA